MAIHHGNEGSVYSGANAIAEVKSWSYNESESITESESLGATSVTYTASGIRSGGGSIECHWDETDTTGQGTLVAGDSVTLNLYPEGNTTGDTYRTGTVVIESEDQSGDSGSIISATYSFKGVLTEGTVA